MTQNFLMTTTEMRTDTGLETAKKLGLLDSEYDRIIEILGREPNFTELSIYSVMWSEHCSYKNSIMWLKTLPKTGPHMLAEAGEENAGLVDIGDGLACAFKIESHNHPSAIEPYQGAATGVGGINRDIFTMGARPIAQLNSLRFGSLELDKTKWHLKGVVKGIGDYGNAFGIPVVGGEVYFDECYNTNPLVNAMSAGIVEVGKTLSAISYGVGNPVYIVGSSTGKDGIHGATFASGDLTEDSADDLPSVQVGDPFQEKLLLEATLELAKTDAIIGMQDMGAAGIICSTSEMSEKGKHGMEIHLDQVPTRQDNMKPFEILLSESQERMLVVVKKGHEKTVENIFEKWDLNAVPIGKVTEGDELNFFMNGELVAQVPASTLVLGGGAPVYEREYSEPEYYRKAQEFKLESIEVPKDLVSVSQTLISNENIASKKWITEQYDSMVGIRNMVTNKPSDAGVVLVKGSKKGLAFTVDCNSKYVNNDPEKGTSIAVAEAARNIVCSGAKPSAITNCLNFGNPYNPEVYWQFVGAIKGMGEACNKFETPVTGGNVSFYNQMVTEESEIPVYPTPTIGMMGILEDRDKMMTMDFKNAGDKIILVGSSKNCIDSSVYLEKIHGIKLSPAPTFDLDEELKVQNGVMHLIDKQIINSAHDVSEGGLFVCLMEKGLNRSLGFEINVQIDIRKDAFLFGESQSRIVITVSEQKEQNVLEELAKMDVPFEILGVVSEGKFSVNGEDFGHIKNSSSAYLGALAGHLNQN